MTAGASAPEARRAPRRRRRRLWIGLGVIALVAVGYGVWAAVTLVRVRSDALEAVDLLAEIREDLGPGAFTGDGEDASIAALRDAEAQFRDAREAADQPLLAPLRFAPWAGRQLRSVIALTGAATEVADIGADTLAEVSATLDAGVGGGTDRTVLVADVGRLVARADARLAAVDLGPHDSLVPALARARDDFAEELNAVRATVAEARAVSEGLERFVTGPSRYLLLAANPTQMRVGSGMFLEGAVLTVADGRLRLDTLRSPEDVRPRVPAVIDPDLADNWFFLRPQEDLRNVALTARFPASAEAAAAIWEGAGFGVVDGVVSVDPVALRAVLAATGPVEAAGRVVTADDVLPFLLHDQYLGTGGPGDEAVRDELLGTIAVGALGHLDEGGWDAVTLAERIAEAARGRHLMAWSRDPVVQAAWEVAGVDGALTAESLVVSVANQSTNKADQFIEVDAGITFEPDGTGTDVFVTVDVRNAVPDGEPAYIAGPNAPDLVYGEYRGFVVVNVPGAATDVAVHGVESLVARGPDGPTLVVAAPVDVLQGQSARVVVGFRLAPGSAPLEVLPSGRVPGIDWATAGDAWRADEPHAVPVPAG